MKAITPTSVEISSRAAVQKPADPSILSVKPLLATWRCLSGFVISIPGRLLRLLRRYQARRIRKAIESYSFEKHVLSRYYRPVVSATLMRVCRGDVETNKFPFYVKRESSVLPINIAMRHRMFPSPEDRELDSSSASRLEFYLPFGSELAKDTKPQLR